MYLKHDRLLEIVVLFLVSGLEFLGAYMCAHLKHAYAYHVYAHAYSCLEIHI